MELYLPTRFLLLTLSVLIVQSPPYYNETFDQANNIQNFRAVDVSNAELHITVDYTYDGQAGDKGVAILAAIMDSNGTSQDRDVMDAEVPLLTGTHTVTLKVMMRSSGKSFTSTWVRVCMATADTAILCKDFSYTKKWSRFNVTTTPPGNTSRPDPSKTVATSTILGKVTGRRSFQMKDQPDGPATEVKLTHMMLESRDRRVTKRARIDDQGNYKFTVDAGKTYIIYPGSFRATPRADTVLNCRPNVRYHKNFTITGPPIND